MPYDDEDVDDGKAEDSWAVLNVFHSVNIAKSITHQTSKAPFNINQ